ncbi:MAG TPA: hypothetical protein VN253_11460 [Kofleriaceae bacterium]|nr:hypothetical protein [Kofleriaceae bacterium]
MSSCASNVPQDKMTGSDGKVKGAKAMVLENGEAKATGIVTYPGGDRIDWKLIEIPEKKRGTLEVKLQWTPPRPGLQLAFDVFDEWNDLIISSSKKTGKKARGRNRSAVVENAKGKYFLRVYAVGRGDAGKYKLSAEFKETAAGPIADWSKLEIPDPPKLAAVPEHVEPCDDLNFDPKKPECKQFCPQSGAPPNWPACDGKCPKPPSIEVEACWKTMPCPNPPDARVKACKPSNWPPCPDKKNPDQNNPNCLVPADPVVGRVISRDVQGGELVLRIGAGSDQGISTAWRAAVVAGPDVSDKAVPGGEVKIVRVDKQRIVGKTKLTAGQIDATPYVKFTPSK